MTDLDPIKTCETIEKKTGRKTVLVSPLPLPADPEQEETKEEEAKKQDDEKKEEDEVINLMYFIDDNASCEILKMRYLDCEILKDPEFVGHFANERDRISQVKLVFLLIYQFLTGNRPTTYCDCVVKNEDAL